MRDSAAWRGLFSADGQVGTEPSFDLRISTRTFEDGAAWRIEIPSVEGPASLRTVIDEGAALDVPVHRVSQGSGMMLQTRAELREMVALGKEHAIEVCLFVGPRASWDTGIQAHTNGGSVLGGALRGADRLSHAVRDIERGCEEGVRSILVADIGLLSLVGQLRDEGHLPSDLIMKVSAAMPIANPASAQVVDRLGANTINVPGDLALDQLASIRAATSLPIDIYIESPDDLGGTLRYHEVPEIVRVAAPVHLKFAVRNSASLYPSGAHLRELALATARERVRRASFAVELLRESEGIGAPGHDGAVRPSVAR